MKKNNYKPIDDNGIRKIVRCIASSTQEIHLENITKWINKINLSDNQRTKIKNLIKLAYQKDYSFDVLYDAMFADDIIFI